MSQKVPPDTSRERNTKNAKHFASKHPCNKEWAAERRELFLFDFQVLLPQSEGRNQKRWLLFILSSLPSGLLFIFLILKVNIDDCGNVNSFTFILISSDLVLSFLISISLHCFFFFLYKFIAIVLWTCINMALDVVSCSYVCSHFWERDKAGIVFPSPPPLISFILCH